MLNALRHQWFGQLQYILQQGDNSPVLNALRHQWFGQLTVPGLLLSGKGCSTPYGINGLGSVCICGGFSYFCTCSTPYGINGLGRMGNKERRNRELPCSTPYGINGLGRPVKLTFWPSLTNTCSTPYGINGLGRYLGWYCPRTC